MLIASLLTSAFLVAGVSAWRALKQVDSPASLKFPLG
jgi:cytochrome d ubiquinol oxidase subunit I